MVGENNSSENIIKDTTISSSSAVVSCEREGLISSLNSKANKLITALYMVTDIMDKDEPLRTKLRLASTDVLSDMHVISYRTDANLINKNINKIAEIVSFLEVASTIRMISEMNFSILKKEFSNLKDSLNKHNNPILIEDFLSSNTGANFGSEISEKYLANTESNLNNFENKTEKRKEVFNRQNTKNFQTNNISSTRIGVQKGSTLMKAIKDIKETKTLGKTNVSNRTNFDNLKKERREAILKIIRVKKEATITDIKIASSGALKTCGEKTLQRELISMVNDGVLKKSGEKRWSRYFL